MTQKDLKPHGKKPPLFLLPLKSLWGVARVLEYGAKRYAKWNWATATSNMATVEEYISAAQRHLSDMQGPDAWAALDESGLPAIDHALTNLVIARWHLWKAGWLAVDPGPGKGVTNDPEAKT